MASDNPFQSRFQSLGQMPTHHAEAVNQQAYRKLHELLSVRLEDVGRCILLRAPRAGYGKTHLLARVRHYLGASHEFVALQPNAGCLIDAGTAVEDVMRRLLRGLPAAGGMTVLDLVSRRLLASALQPLVRSGEVPCQDREGALAALQIRPVETFDFHHPNAVTAHWTRDNFAILGPRLSLEIAQHTGLPVADVAFWLDAFFRFASAPLDHPTRGYVLMDGVRSVMGAGGFNLLVALLVILARLTRVVLIVDDLEGYSADESAALRLASFLGSLRQAVERMDVVLSVNQDIWENAFVPRMSDGLADRLSEVVIDLQPMSAVEMVELLESRAPGKVEEILRHLGKGDLPGHARGLILEAGRAWENMTNTAMQVESVVADPAPVPLSSVTLEVPPVVLVEPVAVAAHFVDIGFADALEPVEEFVLPPKSEVPIEVPEEEPQVESASASADTDRVDELLRRFRDRYGKGGS